MKKRACSNWQSNYVACLSVGIHCNRSWKYSRNKFYACTNLVKFIFKSFASCNLQFQAFLCSKQHGLQIYIKKLSQDSQTFGARCLWLVELKHTFSVCAVVLLLTSHGAQKFYLLVIYMKILLDSDLRNTANTRENFWNVYCFATNQKRDETTENNRQTAAWISHDLI